MKLAKKWNFISVQCRTSKCFGLRMIACKENADHNKHLDFTPSKNAQVLNERKKMCTNTPRAPDCCCSRCSIAK